MTFILMRVILYMLEKLEISPAEINRLRNIHVWIYPKQMMWTSAF